MNLRQNGKVFTSKSVGTGPSSYEKKNLPGRGLTKVEKHCPTCFGGISSHYQEPISLYLQYLALLRLLLLSVVKVPGYEVQLPSTHFHNR